ncbi:hypothetical protein CR513_08733, partial [Mucuna pruriens]
MKHPIEDHSLLDIDLIEELVEEYLQLDSCSEDKENSVQNADFISCLGTTTKEADHEEVHDPPNSKDNSSDNGDLEFEDELSELIHQVCNLENPECTRIDSIPARITLVRRSRPDQPKAEVMTPHLVPNSTQDGQPDLKANTEKSPSLPPLTKLKPLPKHLKYTYLDKEQQLPIIIANNLQ